MARASDSEKRRQWQQRMARFAKAQQSVTQFCQEESVSVPSFYHWRKKLRELARSMPGEASFRPVRLVAAAGISVQLPGGTQLQIPTSDRQALQLAIRTLARADAQRGGGEAC